jgi:hypothetical protein
LHRPLRLRREGHGCLPPWIKIEVKIVGSVKVMETRSPKPVHKIAALEKTGFNVADDEINFNRGFTAIIIAIGGPARFTLTCFSPC